MATRRTILKGTVASAVALAIPKARALIGLPGGAAAGSSGQTFDYYISTTGSDTNPGTLASPWAITSLQRLSANWSSLAGKRIGLLPGTYNVGSMMVNDAFSGAIQIPGGSSGSWTYLGSSDSSGHYSPRTATITAYYNGLYGGHNSSGAGQWDGPMLSHCGKWYDYGTSTLYTYPVGYLEIDGIKFTGFNYKGIRLGGNSSGNGPIITGPVTLQNCELYGGGFNSGDFQDNLCALWVDTFQPTGQGCLVTNNWVHDIVGYSANDMDHLTPLFVFTAPSAGWGYEFSYNTCVNAGNIYGKEGGVEGSNVHHNYLDVSMFTSYCSGYEDWASGSSDQETGLTRTTYIQNNILVTRGATAGGSGGNTFPTLGQNPGPTSGGSVYGWQTPVVMSNNTTVCISAASSGPLVFYAVACNNGVGLGQLKMFNNIYVNNGVSGSWNGWGNYMTTAKTPGVWDYNLDPSGTQWTIVPEAANGSLGSSYTVYSSVSTFASAVAAGSGISGVGAHSVTGAPTFTGATSGQLYALAYQLQAGSAGIGVGSTDGTTAGRPCDMGAFGNTSTTPGCDFAFLP